MKARLFKTLYNKAVSGLPVIGTPEDVAARFAGKRGAADQLTRFYLGLTGATGFVTGLPGFLLMPVTIPADLVGVAALQLHMCAAFAALAGHDVHSNEVREASIGCVLHKIERPGENTEDEEVASRTGVQLAQRVVRFGVERSMKLAQRKVIGKLGLKRLPLLGGFLAAGSDAWVTRHVARRARARFVEQKAIGGGDTDVATAATEPEAVEA